VEHLPATCDLNQLEVLADGVPGAGIYVGPLDSKGLQQVNAWLPDGVRTGIVPVELRSTDGQPLCPVAMARIFPAGPMVPRIISITDSVNLDLKNATRTGSLKVQIEEVMSPESITVTIDNQPIRLLDVLRTDPRPPRHTVDFALPGGLRPGPHTLQISVGIRRLPPTEIVVGP
jgi:hypothetical protein